MKQAIGDEQFDIPWRAGQRLNRSPAKTFALSNAQTGVPAAD